MQRRLGSLPDSADGLPVRLSDGLVPWRAGRLHREHYGRQDARLPSQAGSLTSGLAIAPAERLTSSQAKPKDQLVSISVSLFYYSAAGLCH